MKPIETSYAGCRFRSRLEARWAVFFDQLGIKWEYEPQGYEFDGERYLPDFHLPHFDQFVEVKGDDERLKKDLPGLRKFAAAAQRNVVILGEIPKFPEAEKTLIPFHPCLVNISGEVVAVSSAVIGIPNIRGFVPTMATLPLDLITTEVHRLGAYPAPIVRKAYEAASSARFEHGESGAPSLAPA